MADDHPQMPEMSEQEALREAERIAGGQIGHMDYQALVKLITICNYVQELALVELENRDLLTFIPISGDLMPIVPDCLPESLRIESILRPT